MAKFNFIGEVVIPREFDRFYRHWSKNGKDYASINFAIKANNSLANCELFGFTGEQVHFINTDNERISIPWDKRLDSGAIGDAAYFNKYICNLNSSQIYITSYDLIKELKNTLPNYKGRIKVVGSIEHQPYIDKNGNEKIFTKYNIQSVFKVGDDEKSGLKATYEIFYNASNLNCDDLYSEKKAYLDGYIKQYIADSSPASKYIDNNGIRGAESKGQTFYIKKTFVLNAERLDLNDDKQKKILEYKLNSLKQASSNKKLYRANWECSIVAGAEEVEFDYTQLTDNQKTQVDLGLASLDDFKPKGVILGEKINEVRLIKPLLFGVWSDGVVECDEYALKELTDATIRFAKQETLKDALTSSSASSNFASVEEDFNLDDLFA